MTKRLFDIFFTLIGLMVLFPLFLTLCILIKSKDGGPIFYRGVRVGEHGKPFRIFKFRTMVVDAEKFGASSTADDDPRLTKVGKILRRYKLDELPQLINVLKGDMSIVGPRPQVKWAVDLYNQEEREILNFLPGITDYASIRFPNEGKILLGSTDPDKDYMEKIHSEKMRLSMEYIKTHSFWVDIKIIIQTLIVVFKK